MSFIDRLIFELAPERGLARMRARVQARALMNFDGAKLGRRTASWNARDTNADAASQPGRKRLREVCRDVVRNRPYGARAQRVVTSHVVGAGILPSVKADDDQVKTAVGELIRRHLLSTAIDAQGLLTLFQMQRVVMNTVFCDGEVLVRRRDKFGRFARGLDLPFRIELLEGDYLDGSVQFNGENPVIDGIEYDPTGGVLAYHLFPEHPGAVQWYRRATLQSQRVPADQILHIRRADRPGQVRGVPWMAPVLLRLADLDDYQDAQVKKQQVASLFAFFIESAAEEAATGDGLQTVEPGAMVPLPAGQKMVPSTPPTVEGFEEFNRSVLRSVAMGLGLTYEALSGDLQGVNYSSGRMGRLEMDRNVEEWQQLLMIEQFCRGVAEWFDRFARMTPELTGQAWELDWTAPRRALIDPAKEIPAAITSIEAGLTSLQREQRRLGLDPDEIVRERKEDATAGNVLNPETRGAASNGGAS